MTLHDNGMMIACLEYFWVKNMEDIRRVGRGEPPQGGEVLYVTNIATSTLHDSHPMQVLRRALPPHRYIAGLRLLTPKGMPDDFYAQAAVPVPI